MESPANNNVVIKRHKKRNQDCTEPNTFKRIVTVKNRVNRRISSTFEYRTDSPDRDGALPVELAEYELHVEEGEGPEPQHHGVGDQEGASPVLVAEVGESPDIGQVHREPDDAEQEVDVAAPSFPLGVLAIFRRILKPRVFTPDLLFGRDCRSLQTYYLMFASPGPTRRSPRRGRPRHRSEAAHPGI